MGAPDLQQEIERLTHDYARVQKLGYRDISVEKGDFYLYDENDRVIGISRSRSKVNRSTKLRRPTNLARAQLIELKSVRLIQNSCRIG